jgi:hypothetical protein
MLSAGGSMTSKQKESAMKWQAVVREFEASQLNLKDFCAAKGISRYALQYWRRKPAAKTGNPPAKGLVEIKAVSVPAQRKVGGNIRIIFPSGIIVEPGVDWNQDELNRTLAAVRSL